MNIDFTSDALRDINDIWEYIAADSVASAERVVRAIDSALSLLADFPGIGHTRSDVDDPRYRFWSVYSYLIVYRHSDTVLTVVRIVHGSSDLARLFRRE